MSNEEALAWLRGERSSVNWMQGKQDVRSVAAARYDAAATEQAYWIVRAHHEQLVEVDGND